MWSKNRKIVFLFCPHQFGYKYIRKAQFIDISQLFICNFSFLTLAVSSKFTFYGWHKAGD